MKTTEILDEVSYNYDGLHIIGCTAAGVYVKPTEEMLYLLFTRTMWNKMQKAWLDQKMDFCTRYEHFCGWGCIHSKVQYVFDGTYAVHNDDFTTDMVDVPVYKVLDILVDMEHG